MSKDMDRMIALAGAAAEYASVKERKIFESAGGNRSRLFVAYEEHARFLVDAVQISLEDAQTYCAGQLAMIEDDPAMDADALEGTSYRRLVAIASGDSPQPIDQMARALRRVEVALASRQEVVNVQPAAVHVTVPAPQVSVNVAAPEPTPAPRQDKPWPTRTTIKKRDAQGRADVIETTPIDD